MFDRVRSALAGGRPSVETVLDTAVVHPGDGVTGRVSVVADRKEAALSRVTVGLVVQSEFVPVLERRMVPWSAQLWHTDLRRDVLLAPQQRLDLAFRFALPVETPVTAVGDAVLPFVVGVRTEVVVHDGQDTGDLDRLLVQPLPSQSRVLDAFGVLGAHFRSVTVHPGRLPSLPQEFDFQQVLVFTPPSWCADRFERITLTFVAGPRDLCVLVTAHPRGGLIRPAAVTARWTVNHEDACVTDWASLIGGWLQGARG
ncbi:sporulation protein [Actinophytocola sp. KF-1]